MESREIVDLTVCEDSGTTIVYHVIDDASQGSVKEEEPNARESRKRPREGVVQDDGPFFISLEGAASSLGETSSHHVRAFLGVLETLRNFGPLWTAAEASLIRRLLGAPDKVVAVYLRLVDRKDLWQRVDKLLGFWELREAGEDDGNDEVPNEHAFEHAGDSPCVEGSSPVDQLKSYEEEAAYVGVGFDESEGQGSRRSSSSSRSDMTTPETSASAQERLDRIAAIMQNLAQLNFVKPLPLKAMNPLLLRELLQSSCFSVKELKCLLRELDPRSKVPSSRCDLVEQLLSTFRQNVISNFFQTSGKEFRIQRILNLVEASINARSLVVPPDCVSELLLVRLEPDARLLVKRIQRLANAVAGSARHSSGAAVGVNDNITRWSLIDAFGKVRYVNYCQHLSKGRFLFSSREAFLAYEASHELSSFMIKTIQGCDLDPSDGSQAYNALNQLRSLGLCAELRDGRDSTIVSLNAAVEACRCALATISNLDPALFRDEDFHPQFLSNLAWGSPRSVIESERPSFWQSLSAGCIISSALWEYVQHIRKVSNGADFRRSAAICKLLLASGFTPHRRYKYWDVLRIDVGHLYKLKSEDDSSSATALDWQREVCIRALSDPTVRGGGRIHLSAIGKLDAACSTSLDGAFGCNNPDLMLNHHIKRLNEALGNDQGECSKASWVILVGGKLKQQSSKGKAEYLGFDDKITGVEDLVMQHAYHEGLQTSRTPQKTGWVGWSDECRALRGLIPLLLWDQLFASLPDVFVCPWQDSPLDLDYDYQFFKNRSAVLTKRLNEIRNASPIELAEIVRTTCLEHDGQSARWLNWRSVCIPQLQLIVMGLGGPAVAAILTAQIVNSRHFEGGMPDLLLLRVTRSAHKGGEVFSSEELLQNLLPSSVVPVEADDQIKVPKSLPWRPSASPSAPALELDELRQIDVDIMLVEVKSVNDILRQGQRAWLRVLRAAGVNAFVCKVTDRNKVTDME